LIVVAEIRTGRVIFESCRFIDELVFLVTWQLSEYFPFEIFSMLEILRLFNLNLIAGRCVLPSGL